MHEMSDPDDEVVLFGSAMRDLLSKPWRDEQYERMLKGQEFSLTETSLHMSGPSTVIAADILNEAQGDSWSVRSGVVRRNQQEEPHVWLRHFSGMILDLAADQFSMSPVVAFHEASDTLWHYEDHGEIDPEAVQDLVEIWKNHISPEQMQNILSKAEGLTMPEPDDMPQI
ncbi:MAG: hypothetical protein ABJN42_13765 [Roseibium sp.]|uniref:hypothetical protein n=1 Tax=Roseibium sp. TaxID=1936156 RepID=UPI00329893F2